VDCEVFLCSCGPGAESPLSFRTPPLLFVDPLLAAGRHVDEVRASCCRYAVAPVPGGGAGAWNELLLPSTSHRGLGRVMVTHGDSRILEIEYINTS
jgi:hypothetical protein